MTETCTGGKKEFFSSLAIAAILYFVSEYIKFILPSYKVVGIILQILLFSILVYFVLTRYSAVFTYDLDKNTLKVTRKIGHRHKQLEIKFTDMKSISNMPKSGVKTYNMKKTIFPRRTDTYLYFGEYALCFSPSRAMCEKLKRVIKKNT